MNLDGKPDDDARRDTNYPCLDEDNGEEEINKDLDLEVKGSTRERSSRKSNDFQTSISTSTPEGRKRVSNWASLFQTPEENMMVEKSKVGQYSCTKLLRDMEMAELEFEEEDKMLEVDDEELIRLRKEWC
jgi:hypothetical protein